MSTFAPPKEDRVSFDDDTIADNIRAEALLGARNALHIAPGHSHVVVRAVRTSPVDTSVGDVYEASARAVWNAFGMPDHDLSISDRPLIAYRFRELRGRRLLGVTESRHWFGGKHDD